MMSPRPGDKIYIPTRQHVSPGEDDFVGGICTVAGVYTPKVVNAVWTSTGMTETPRVLLELARSGSTDTWVSLEEDPASWFKWDDYLAPNQAAWRAEYGDPGEGRRSTPDEGRGTSPLAVRKQS